MGILDRLTGGNTLYYPGCLTKFAAPEVMENYKRILDVLGVDYIMLKELELCCGSPPLNAGYSEDFNSLAEKNMKVFKEHGVSSIVTNCPACYHIFSVEYPKHGFKIKVEHMTQLIAKNLKKLKVKTVSEKVTYHDPCHLGRYSEIYDEPRAILKHLGYEVVEMALSHKNSLCCGGGGGFRSNKPKVADEVAKLRVSQADGMKIVTPCPMCTKHMEKFGDVVELSEVIVRGLG
jgi:Fe-S oxidoreductase